MILGQVSRLSIGTGVRSSAFDDNSHLRAGGSDDVGDCHKPLPLQTDEEGVMLNHGIHRASNWSDLLHAAIFAQEGSQDMTHQGYWAEANRHLYPTGAHILRLKLEEFSDDVALREFLSLFCGGQNNIPYHKTSATKVAIWDDRHFH